MEKVNKRKTLCIQNKINIIKLAPVTDYEVNPKPINDTISKEDTTSLKTFIENNEEQNDTKKNEKKIAKRNTKKSKSIIHLQHSKNLNDAIKWGNEEIKELQHMANDYRDELSLGRMNYFGLNRDELNFALSYRTINPEKLIKQYAHIKDRINDDQPELLERELRISIDKSKRNFDKSILEDELRKDKEKFFTRLLQQDTKDMAEARKIKKNNLSSLIPFVGSN